MLADFMQALDALLAGVSTMTVFEDAVTVLHLLAMAVALGSVVANDLKLLHGAFRPFGWNDLTLLRSAHVMIARALVVLWITGLLLIALRAGFTPDQMTPKLITKLLTVSLLTLTALMMARVGLPLLERSVGWSLLALPLGRKLVLALCAGLSAAGWTTALILGGSSFLKTAEMDAVFALAVLIHGTALGGALSLALLGHVWHLIEAARAARLEAYWASGRALPRN